MHEILGIFEDFVHLNKSRMRESDINIVGLGCTVQDTLLTYPEACGPHQQLYKPRSSMSLPTMFRKLKKNEGKVMRFLLSTSETEINNSDGPPTPATHPG